MAYLKLVAIKENIDWLQGDSTVVRAEFFRYIIIYNLLNHVPLIVEPWYV
jgi:hypothetical protein